eukprot:NODE_3800_length_1161_cov_46.005780_g3614_i0.p1 GENE.NODE_3800_length_1161_cov_46.005780_g3614_i0~~NODE_3800_length_1161_cov_46.005780_g3614_i0.p1  ORF type:complete len:348 (-),score=98.54 NODE_3800_length_1161_cov_46.005780_g3614_i0:56-1099(-)
MDFFAFVQNAAEQGPAYFQNQQEMDPNDYADRSAQAIPGDVRMFSGCRDDQTSADVSNVSQFQLPPGTGPGGAGGACTSAMVSVLSQGECTWVQLLDGMRDILSQKGYSQVPQLSSSREMDLNTPCNIIQPNGNGRTKALLVGINYFGQQGELHGCVNDVLTMRQNIINFGFDENNMRILVDDPNENPYAEPTSRNILEGMHWLVDSAQPGDSLFFHYSGHGGHMRDDDGDEADGFDETLIPSDYQQVGQIRDDEVFTSLVLPLPQGCQLTVVMDCCHSGTVLDLPFMFKADDNTMAAVHEGQPPAMAPNPKFNLEHLLKVAGAMFESFQQGGMEAALRTGMSSFFM